MLTQKTVADSLSVILMPGVMTSMVLLLLMIPAELPFKLLILLGGEWVQRNKFKLTGIVLAVVTPPAFYGGAWFVLEILARGWSAEMLRYLFAAIFLALIIVIAPNFYPTLKIALAVGVTVVLSVTVWLLWTNWITTDILAMILSFVVVSAFGPRVIRFWYLVPIVIAVGVGYDFFHVYITGAMERAYIPAVEASLPLVLAVPSGLGLDAVPVSGLGLGDICVVLALLLAVARISKRIGRIHLYVAALVGLVLAEVAVIVAGRITQHWQPASLYQGITIAGCVALTAAFTNTWPELKRRGEYDTSA